MKTRGGTTVIREPFRCPRSFKEVHVYVDGAARGNPGPAGIGVLIRTPEGDTVAEFGLAIDVATNNYAEYTALVHALRLLSALEAECVVVFTDSELVARQLSGEYRVREQSLKSLYAQVMNMLSLYPRWRVEHIGREKNREADRLASEAARGQAGGGHGMRDPVSRHGSSGGDPDGKTPTLF